MIEQLKAKYGTVFKYSAPVSEVDIYFRLLTKKEFDIFNSLCTEHGISDKAENYVLKTAVVYPENFDYDTLYAGEVTSLVKGIVENCGFIDIDVFKNELNNRRAMAGMLAEQMIGFISKAFPAYKVEDLDNKNYKEMARLLALAENFLGAHLAIDEEEENAAKRENLAAEAKEKATNFMKQYKQGK